MLSPWCRRLRRWRSLGNILHRRQRIRRRLNMCRRLLYRRQRPILIILTLLLLGPIRSIRLSIRTRRWDVLLDLRRLRLRFLLHIYIRLKDMRLYPYPTRPSVFLPFQLRVVGRWRSRIFAAFGLDPIAFEYAVVDPLGARAVEGGVEDGGGGDALVF